MSLRTKVAGAFCGIMSTLAGVALGYFATNLLSPPPLACLLFVVAIASGFLLTGSLRREGKSRRTILLAGLAVCALPLIVAFGVTRGLLMVESSQLTG